MIDGIENGLAFKLNSNSLKLFAVVTPCNDKIELTAAIVKAHLEQKHFSHLFINDYLVFDLVYRYNHATSESFEFEIGEQRDATCEISLSDDMMQAYLTLTPNFGGKNVTLSDAQKLLQEKGIVWGVVSTEEIEAALAEGQVSKFVIAQGFEPVEGVDTQFLSLIPEIEQNERKPLVNEDGVVDYRELGDSVIVHKDAVLVHRIPPVKGEDGRNVLGEIVKPSGGADIPFSGDKKGVCINPEDENQLISTITGQPVLVPHGMIVLPVLTVKRVDLLSGNIRFNGSVVVNGDVKEGMKIFALEDITIDGNVFSSRIECMGNLVIKGSVTGNTELLAGGGVIVKGGLQGYSKTENQKDEEHAAKIITRGSVCIGFAENFVIEAGVDIVIDKYSMNNHLMAQNKIVIGSKMGGTKSAIIGGVTWAMMLVKATLIGSSSGMKTRIQVGSNPHVQKRVAEIKSAFALNAKSQSDIKTVLTFIENHPEKRNEETLEKLHHTLSKLIIEADAYHAELGELIENMTNIEDAKVIATFGIYTGSEIQINNVSWKAQENRGKSVFRLVRREMSITTR